MKKILLLAFVGIFLLFIGTSRAYTIKDNSIFINDSNAYISAEPHTLHSSGYVTFIVQPKDYTGDVNVIWGFNTSITKPTSAELYHPHNVSWNTSSSIFVPNVNGFWETAKSCDYGNEYNTYKREVNYTLSGNNTTTTEQKVFCFDSWSQTGNNYTVYWHTEHTKQVNWVDVSQHINSIEHDFDGKNKWYYATNLPVVAGHTYILRSYIKVPVSLEGSSGKYDFAIYPSSYGTNIGQAISNGHFYYLDPWWNGSWSSRYQITINNTDSITHTNEIILLDITGTDCETDTNSTRIVYKNTTEVDFEWYNADKKKLYFINNDSVSASSSDTNFALYCNNSGASDGSTSLFLVADDFEDGTTGSWARSTTTDVSMSAEASCAKSGNYGLFCYSHNVNDGCYRDFTQQTGTIYATFDLKTNDTAHTINQQIMLGEGWINDGSLNDIQIMFPDNDDNIKYYDGSTHTVYSGYSDQTWYNNYIKLSVPSDNFDWNFYEGSTSRYSATSLGTRGTVAHVDEFDLFEGNSFPHYLYFCIDNFFISTTPIDTYDTSATAELGSKETPPKTISGTVKDASGNAISGARVYILYQNNNSLLANLTTNATGGFEYSTSLTGNFSICAYNPTNVSQGGSCKPFVEVT